MFSRQPLFRAQALQQYAQSREKAVLPRFVTPPVFLCFWLLLGLLLLATMLAWQVQVPIYRGASGALLDAPPSSQQATNGWQAILFVPATPTPELHVGAALTLADRADRRVVCRDDCLRAARRADTSASTPAVCPHGRSGPGHYSALSGGAGDVGRRFRQMPSQDSSLSAQVPVGQQSVLSLLPQLLSGLIGG